MAVLRGGRLIDDDEAEDVRWILKLFYELVQYRNIHAGQWEEAAALIASEWRNTFFFGSYNFPGRKTTQYQVDSTGALALQQFCAIADALITPKNRLWHGLEGDDEVMADRQTRLWFDQVRKVMFRERYRATANFHAQNYSNWQSLGAFGNSVMFIDEVDRRFTGGMPGLRYKAVPLGECFYAENHQGMVTTLIRWFRLTAYQAMQKFGEEWLPDSLRPALQQNLQTPYQFLHCVTPRDVDRYDPERLDYRGMPYASWYVSIEGQCLVAPEGGFREFPYAVSRYNQTPGEVYGRGPAQQTLPGLKTLNAQKSTMLKVGHRQGDPVLLTPDDGITDWDVTPGALNKGGVNQDGKPLVHVLPAGDFSITEKMMLEERGIIENMFLTPLFKTLMQNPNMTATQVTELINERAMLVSPTLGRQHSEYVGVGLAPRELALLMRMRDHRGNPMLPPLPPLLRQRGTRIQVTDTSPLALQARASEVSGTMRTLDVAHQIAINTGDPSVYDPFDLETILPAVGEANEMPIRFFSTPKAIAAKRQNRARQQQIQQQIQALPAQAAMVKAQAVASKATPIGQQPQQQLPPQ